MLERSEASQKHASNVIPSERKRRDVLLRACPKKSQKIAKQEISPHFNRRDDTTR